MLDQTQIQTLLTAAKDAMNLAYVPHSQFRVGAAILYSDDSIVTGCNIENASFGATICAERTAISSAISQGKTQGNSCSIVAVCVTNTTDTKITPCGICRQVLYEFGTDFPVICSNVDGAFDVHTIRELLPHAFTL